MADFSGRRDFSDNGTRKEEALRRFNVKVWQYLFIEHKKHQWHQKYKLHYKNTLFSLF